MLKPQIFLVALALAAAASTPVYAVLAESNNAPKRTDAKKAAAKAATTVARQAVGAAVGGTAGKVIAGGPIGAAVGVLLTPSEISKEQDRVPANPRSTKGSSSSGKIARE